MYELIQQEKGKPGIGIQLTRQVLNLNSSSLVQLISSSLCETETFGGIVFNLLIKE